MPIRRTLRRRKPPTRTLTGSRAKKCRPWACSKAPDRPNGQPVRLPPLRICLDAGHGMANRMHGVYDPGAVSGQFQEADVALAWVSVLRRELLALNDVEVFLTRANNVSPTPLQRRAAYAKEMNCDALLSLHTNAFRDDAANGVETLWRTSGSDRLASVVNQVLVHEMGLRDRGIKRRPLLAVLSFQPSVLLELGFITNAADRVAMHSDEIRQRTCRRLARVVVAHLRGGQD